MSNRILNVELKTARRDPHEAEVWITVTAERVNPTSEIRGRLVGPKSTKHTTVDIAYPLRPFQKKPANLPDLTVRAVIPEPSFWKPESPFVYDVVVELWEENQRCDLHKTTYALR